LRAFVDLLEPVKHYERGRQQPGATQFTPLTGLVDCARPDSGAAREFAAAVDELVLARPISDETAKAVARQLAAWSETADGLAKGFASRAPRLHEALPLLQALVVASEVGQGALQTLASGKAPAPAWLPAQFARLDQAAKPHAACELPVIASLKLLVAAAAGQDQRAALTDEAWKQLLKDASSPPAKPAAAQ
jgi:hypothetical protein